MLGHANTVEQVKGAVHRSVWHVFLLSCDILTQWSRLISSSLANGGDSDEQIII